MFPVNDPIDNEDCQLVLNGIGKKLTITRETNADITVMLTGTDGSTIDYFVDSRDAQMLIGFLKGCR